MDLTGDILPTDLAGEWVEECFGEFTVAVWGVEEGDGEYEGELEAERPIGQFCEAAEWSVPAVH